MTNERSNSEGAAETNSPSNVTFDLEERTACFGEQVIRFAKTLPITPISRSLVDQLVRAATSIGANYCEANEAESKKDFRHKISLCRKEARETRHWLRMIAVAVEDAARKSSDRAMVVLRP